MVQLTTFLVVVSTATTMCVSKQDQNNRASLIIENFVNTPAVFLNATSATRRADHGSISRQYRQDKRKRHSKRNIYSKNSNRAAAVFKPWSEHSKGVPSMGPSGKPQNYRTRSPDGTEYIHTYSEEHIHVNEDMQVIDPVSMESTHQNTYKPNKYFKKYPNHGQSEQEIPKSIYKNPPKTSASNDDPSFNSLDSMIKYMGNVGYQQFEKYSNRQKQKNFHPMTNTNIPIEVEDYPELEDNYSAHRPPQANFHQVPVKSLTDYSVQQIPDHPPQSLKYMSHQDYLPNNFASPSTYSSQQENPYLAQASQPIYTSQPEHPPQNYVSKPTHTGHQDQRPKNFVSQSTYTSHQDHPAQNYVSKPTHPGQQEYPDKNFASQPTDTSHQDHLPKNFASRPIYTIHQDHSLKNFGVQVTNTRHEKHPSKNFASQSTYTRPQEHSPKNVVSQPSYATHQEHPPRILTPQPTYTIQHDGGFKPMIPSSFSLANSHTTSANPIEQYIELTTSNYKNIEDTTENYPKIKPIKKIIKHNYSRSRGVPDYTVQESRDSVVTSQAPITRHAKKQRQSSRKPTRASNDSKRNQERDKDIAHPKAVRTRGSIKYGDRVNEGDFK